MKFLIPEGKSVLYFGLYDENILRLLQPKDAVGISEETSFAETTNIRYVKSAFQDFIPDKKFDYIVLDSTLGKASDISKHLKNISLACDKHTRVIIHQENHLWEPFLKLASALGMKNKEKTNNWLSIGDIHTFLKSSGFEPTRTFKRNIFPLRLFFLGDIINWLSVAFPIFDFFLLDQFIVARAILPMKNENPSATICLTVRDEEKNIEPIVKSLPKICEQQEILFVEGNSSDNTVEEIKRMQQLYPEKNIHLLHQKGKGQGDAIRMGFNSAEGEIVILYEGDGTSEPEDLFYVYDCMKNERFEFIEGSRFAYPVVADSMPFINKLGNIFFAKWFSLFLAQRSTDVLSGIKAISKKNFEPIEKTWGHLGIHDPFGDFELLYGAARYGLKIGEIPIHYKPRVHGTSKTHAFTHGSYLLTMAWKGYWIFKLSKHRNANIQMNTNDTDSKKEAEHTNAY